MSSTITERQRINTSSAVKVPCKAATTANITLLGEQTIDGVSCVTNDRVLVKNQTTASENGIYICNTSSWSRARDWDGAYDVKKGTFVYVTGGTNSGFWYVTTSDPIVPGTTNVTIAQASSQLLTFSAFAQLLFDDTDAAAALTTLGVSTYIQTLLDDATAGAALTTLGVSAFVQTVLDDANASLARTTLGAAGLTDNNTLSGDNLIKDTLVIYDPNDNTKKVRFDVEGVTTGNTRVLTVPDRDMTIGLVSGTAQDTSTGATSYDFTGIPSWVKRITVMVTGTSTNGTSIPIIQIGDAGGVETTGYLGAVSVLSSVVSSANHNTGFALQQAWSATVVVHGSLVLTLLDAATNTWTAAGVLGRTDGLSTIVVGGAKALSTTLDRVRLTTVNGTDTFDAGSVNILYE